MSSSNPIYLDFVVWCCAIWSIYLLHIFGFWRKNISRKHARNALLACLRGWLLAVAAACAGRRKARKYFAALCGLPQVPASELAAPADAGRAAAIRPACIHSWEERERRAPFWGSGLESILAVGSLTDGGWSLVYGLGPWGSTSAVVICPDRLRRCIFYGIN